MRSRGPVGDRGVLPALLAFVALLILVSWRKWGNPELDPGADLTAASLVADGGYLLYEDVRYFYGPVGLYSLALAFKVLGTSFTVAFAFGLSQMLAILAAFYVLARRWLPATTSGVATAVLAAIGLSGTLFNFVLPHTNSATFGLLAVLLQLLAVGHRRFLAAGVAVGVAALTRPEFLVVAVAVAAGAVLGELRAAGVRPAVRAGLSMAAPALVIGGTVLGAFALAVGADRLFFENLIPVDFTRVAGFRFQEDWAPFTVESLVATLARGLIWTALVGGAAASLLRFRRSKGAGGKLSALWPLAIAVLGLATLDGLARLTGAFPGTRGAVEDDVVRLLLPMSWLPVAAFAGAGLVAHSAFRRERPPFSDSWVMDAALVAGAAALALRAYNEFTTDIYATYYAALPLLCAALLHERLARRLPGARPVFVGTLAAAAALLAVHAYVGLYRDNNTEVQTARGTYVSSDRTGPEIQRTVDLLRESSRAGDRLLALPDDPGLHFMSGLEPALYELTFLPGTLDSRADERAAIRRMERLRPRFVVIGARRFDQYGFPEIGEDYNRLLLDFVRGRYSREATFGNFRDPPRNSMPSEAFEVRTLPD